MSRSFLDDLKDLLEENYIIDKVMISGTRTETPTLTVHFEGGTHIYARCPVEQIPEVKDFIKYNYPDVPFIER